MRRQWACSKCGFACSSTWRSLYPSRPVICNTCKSKEKNNIYQISPSTLENMSFTVGMIYGKLPFEPLNVVKEEHCEIGLQDHIYCGSTSFNTSTSVLESGNMIQIKQEYDWQHMTILEAKKQSQIWDTRKVQKKRRSKLPQYSLSPLSRLIKQLHHVYHSNINKISTAYDRLHIHKRAPKYDDVLIYEKCKYIPENEIGLGAKKIVLSPPNNSSMIRSYMSEYSCGYTTSSSANETGATYSNCLIDVPILISNPSA
ncbi:hypothetical protein CASFOL_019817 [Castilleja foliolosa]|uniref:GATA-type domain-containing protein n=1 Tax=Castilleja foliolosa TaxID=1961234 RepID=A0ABD3CZ28_9LAMI